MRVYYFVLICSLSAYEATVPAGRQALIKTDLSIAIPPNTYARIAPRSGLAVKKMIDCGAGVVDYDYRGPVGVVLFNHGSEDFKVNKGDRVAQLILERICMADIEEVRSGLDLSLLDVLRSLRQRPDSNERFAGEAFHKKTKRLGNRVGFANKMLYVVDQENGGIRRSTFLFLLLWAK